SASIAEPIPPRPCRHPSQAEGNGATSCLSTNRRASQERQSPAEASSARAPASEQALGSCRWPWLQGTGDAQRPEEHLGSQRSAGGRVPAAENIELLAIRLVEFLQPPGHCLVRGVQSAA